MINSRLLRQPVIIELKHDAEESFMHFLILLLTMKFFWFMNIENSYKALSNVKINSDWHSNIKVISSNFNSKLTKIIDIEIFNEAKIFYLNNKLEISRYFHFINLNTMIEEIELIENSLSRALTNSTDNSSMQILTILNSIYERYQDRLSSSLISNNFSKRKIYGIYYTPSYLAKEMVNLTINSSLKYMENLLSEKNDSQFIEELSSFRILDPSCGSGIFLIHSFRIINDFYKRCKNFVIEGKCNNDKILNLLNIDPFEIFNRHIFGIDKDKIAIDITKLLVIMEMMITDKESFKSLFNSKIHQNKKISLFESNIINADSLIDSFDQFFSISDNKFTIIIGNPPWQKILKKEYKENQLSHFLLQKGQPDYYRFFIERSLQLCNPYNSKICFLTPNSWFTIPSATKLREEINNQFNLEKIISLPSKIFQGVSTNISIFLINNQDKKNETIDVYVFKPKDTINMLKFVNAISKKDIKEPDFSFKINIPENVLEVFHYIKNNNKTINLDEITDMTIGYQLYHNTIHSSEEINNKLYHSIYKKNHHYKKEIRTSDIDKFFINYDKACSFVDTNAHFFRKISEKFKRGYRILMRESIGKEGITSARLEKDFLFPKSIIVIALKKKEMNKSNRSLILNLIGILNSKLIWFEYLILGEKGNQELFPRISKKTLIKVIIPEDFALLKIDNFVLEIESLMKWKYELNQEEYSQIELIDKKIKVLEDNIDSMIFDYFKLNKSQIEIILNFLKNPQYII